MSGNTNGTLRAHMCANAVRDFLANGVQVNLDFLKILT